MVVNRKCSLKNRSMWDANRSALQTLHKVSAKASEQNYFQGGGTHNWVDYYESKIESDQSCLNEWYAMDNLESKRPPSPDSIRTKPTEREEAEKVIRSTLKEIMMSVDLDEVTSKYIRSRLEEELDMDLAEYKSFIDQEMLTILGQMDAPTEIFDHVYLGSEWNASNYEELQRNGVGHILNVTREIDNFFPGSFDYLNIRVCDDEKTDLLKHWDDTYKYITKAREQGSKVLVHCKMGVSRSASVVIAYAMKACAWDFDKALHHVKDKRNCIKPNQSFLSQLVTYQGILDANRNKEKLQRSKSETNLKTSNGSKSEKVLVGSEPTPVLQALSKNNLQTTMSGQDLRHLGERPKSWSPDNKINSRLVPAEKSSSLEDLGQRATSKESVKNIQQTSYKHSSARHVLMPCDNGESYSVSPNQIVLLPHQNHEQLSTSVDKKVSELEITLNRTKLVSSLASQFETTAQGQHAVDASVKGDNSEDGRVAAPLATVSVKKETWDPGESIAEQINVSYCESTSDACDLKTSSVSESQPVWTSSTVVKNIPETARPVSFNSTKVPESQQTFQSKFGKVIKDSDQFSNKLDSVFDCEEKRQHSVSVSSIPEQGATENRECPSRQSSWSSYDSAVVMGYPNETPTEKLSRHSSWGSGDTRILPSRNSSWGSYDIKPRGSISYNNEKNEKTLHSSSSELESTSSSIFPYDKEEIPWNPGKVKRTKEKLEEGVLNQTDFTSDKSLSSETVFDCSEPMSTQDAHIEAVNKALIHAINTHRSDSLLSTSDNNSAISDTIDIPKDQSKSGYSLSLSRLSVSAPENCTLILLSTDQPLSRSASNIPNIETHKADSSSIISTAQCSSVKQQKTFIEKKMHKEGITKKSDEQLCTKGNSGFVRNLKKEFEAKTSTSNEQTNSTEATDGLKPKCRGSSLPSSPVSIHQQKERTDSTGTDDKSVKSLRGRFENSKDGQEGFKTKFITKSAFRKNKNTRHSCIGLPSEKSSSGVAQTPLLNNLNKNTSHGEKNLDGDFKRPPVIPAVQSNSPARVVASTVIAKAATKKQQQQYGRSHPLHLLNINNSRHNNPVYNTM